LYCTPNGPGAELALACLLDHLLYLIPAGFLPVKFQSWCQWVYLGLADALILLPGFITDGVSEVAVDLSFGAGELAAVLLP